MADSAVSSLLQNLSRLLVDKVLLLSSVEYKIRSLSNEFMFIDIFLKSSEGKRGNKIVKEVVNQIRDAAHKVEDVVDTYVAEASIQRGRNIWSKLVHYPSHLMMLHGVDAEIEKIKRSIDEIYKNKDRYSIREGEFQSGDDTQESLRKRRRDVEEDEVVGLVHDSSVVTKQLKEVGPCRDVVSIIGMGGLGKTTLARKIYNSKEVQELFPYRAWGYVSNDYRVKELLLSLLKCLLSASEYNNLFKKRDDEAIASESEEEMKEKVKQSLKGKKYLVVLDDVWKIEVWDELKGAFPDNNNGSRILITSRMKEVASYTGATSPYHLPFLNKEESWELFSKKVFRREDCPPDLMELGRLLVESCGGLPLAIIVLAGLVAKKDRSQREWLKIKGHVTWHLGQDKTKLMDILKLSYDYLPQALKPCFLYFGIYPEDYEIPAKELIKLWIAEGFVQPKEIGTSNVPEPEDVADHYLDELVDRSLVQVASRRSDGGVRMCRIHDLLRDLCISEGKADKFMEVCTESNIRGQSSPRKLSIHCATKYYLSSNIGNQSCSRSLFFFAQESKYQDLILKNLKLARVLYFRGGYLESIPSDLETMIHLRYLRIDFGVKTIPNFIYNLWNLETLDIQSLGVTNFSKMWKLKQLRHVRVRSGIRLSKGMSRKSGKTMWNLQTLSWVDIDPKMASAIRKGRFPSLKKLVLRKMNQELNVKYSVREQLQSLHCLGNLGTLQIKDTPELPLEARAYPPNLTKVSLRYFDKFEPRCMSALGRLPNLQILKITNPSYIRGGYHLNCATGEFPRLQVLQMKRIHVESWRLEKGAMPSLQHLVIEDCYRLNELPEELWSLTALQQMHVAKPTSALKDSLQNVVLNNGCKLIISDDVIDGGRNRR